MRGLIASFGYAIAGLVTLVRRDRNARIHLAVTFTIVVLALALGVTRADWLWLVAAFGMVWTAEALNAAIEILCDAVHPDRSEAIGQVKDVAAGAVLAASVTAALIGLIVLAPYVLTTG